MVFLFIRVRVQVKDTSAILLSFSLIIKSVLQASHPRHSHSSASRRTLNTVQTSELNHDTQKSSFFLLQKDSESIIPAFHSSSLAGDSFSNRTFLSVPSVGSCAIATAVVVAVSVGDVPVFIADVGTEKDDDGVVGMDDNSLARRARATPLQLNTIQPLALNFLRRGNISLPKNSAITASSIDQAPRIASISNFGATIRSRRNGRGVAFESHGEKVSKGGDKDEEDFSTKKSPSMVRRRTSRPNRVNMLSPMVLRAGHPCSMWSWNRYAYSPDNSRLVKCGRCQSHFHDGRIAIVVVIVVAPAPVPFPVSKSSPSSASSNAGRP
ncbi:MAG: hypothetical protein J3R72DRAFT_427523 [Linnemannia gamsii]|nr:MAG: hypothetical protein J3R72DRAFT_427523 [Linnemannia gamsii]